MGRAILLGAILAAALVAFGAATTPGFLTSDRGALGAGAALVVLGAYALAAWRLTPTPGVARFAIAAAVIYVGEILLEYVLLPKDNTSWGLTEFGTVFVLLAASGLSAARRTGKLSQAALAGVWTAMAASLAWYVVLLAVFYAFRGSDRQLAVLRAEGDFEDFARSGGKDLQVFLMGDMLGAGVFHLLLSPIFGALLGAAGGLGGLAARRHP